MSAVSSVFIKDEGRSTYKRSARNKQNLLSLCVYDGELKLEQDDFLSPDIKTIKFMNMLNYAYL
jgi:hypothetical protein